METVEFLFCCTQLSCDPGENGALHEDEPIDLPATAAHSTEALEEECVDTRSPSGERADGLSDDEAPGGDVDDAAPEDLGRPAVAVATVSKENGASRESWRKLGSPRESTEGQTDEAWSSWAALKEEDPRLLEARANSAYCDDANIVVDVQ